MSFTLQNEIAYFEILRESLKHEIEALKGIRDDDLTFKGEKRKKRDIENRESQRKKCEKHLQNLQTLQKNFDSFISSNNEIARNIKNSKHKRNKAIITNAVLKLKTSHMNLDIKEIEDKLREDSSDLPEGTVIKGIKGILDLPEYAVLSTRGVAPIKNVELLKKICGKNELFSHTPTEVNLKENQISLVMPLGFIYNSRGSKIRSRLDFVVLSRNEENEAFPEPVSKLSPLLIITPCLWEPRIVSFQGVSTVNDSLKNLYCPVPYISKDILLEGKPWNPMSNIYWGPLDEDWNAFTERPIKDAQHPFNIENLKNLVRYPELLFFTRNRMVDTNQIETDNIEACQLAMSLWRNLVEETENLQMMLFEKSVRKSQTDPEIPSEWFQLYNDFKIKSENIPVSMNKETTSRILSDACEKAQAFEKHDSNRKYAPQIFNDHMRHLKQSGVFTKVIRLHEAYCLSNDVDKMALSLASQFVYSDTINQLLTFYDQIKFFYHDDVNDTDKISQSHIKAESSMCSWMPTSPKATHLIKQKIRIKSEEYIADFFAHGCWIQWDDKGPFFDFFMFVDPKSTEEDKEESMKFFLKDKFEKCQIDTSEKNNQMNCNQNDAVQISLQFSQKILDFGKSQ